MIRHISKDESSDESILVLHDNSEILANCYDKNYNGDEDRHPILLNYSDSEEEDPEEDRIPNLLDVSDSEESVAENIRLLPEYGIYNSELSTNSTSK